MAARANAADSGNNANDDLDTLSCAVCLNPFDTAQRRPWDLGCGHCFCEACVRQSRSSFARCPECRARTSQPHVAVALLRFLESRAASAAPPSPSSSATRRTTRRQAAAAAQQQQQQQQQQNQNYGTTAGIAATAAAAAAATPPSGGGGGSSAGWSPCATMASKASRTRAHEAQQYQSPAGRSLRSAIPAERKHPTWNSRSHWSQRRMVRSPKAPRKKSGWRHSTHPAPAPSVS